MVSKLRRNVAAVLVAAASAAVVSAALAQEAAPAGPYGLPISAAFPFEKKAIAVIDSEIAYVDEGSGPVVLFLHGNPTSSYLWRNVIPHVVGAGYRAVAPDLIGMGDSGKPEIGYTFADHAAYLDAFIEATGLTAMTMVVHDWGSALGMRHARLNPDSVVAIAMMEAIIPPAMPAPSYEAMGPEIGELFRSLRTAGVGEEMVLHNNFFVEEILRNIGVARPLSEEVMAHYRAPYPTPESRLPTLQWPREIPIAGEPKEAHDAVVENGEWLRQSGIPKLFFHAKPGALSPPQAVAWAVENVPNIETRFLGAGVHYLQEEHPEQIGTGLVDWLRRNHGRSEQ